MINILCDNIYACHIAFVCHLLNLDYIIVTSNSNRDVDFRTHPEYEEYYMKVLTNLKRETGEYITLEFLEHYIKNNINSVYSVTPNLAATASIVLPSTSMMQCEKELYTLLISNGIFVDAVTYTNELLPDNAFMSWIFSEYYHRIMLTQEHAFWYMNNVAHKINVVAFSLICIFSREGKNAGNHLPYYTAIRAAKYTVPGIPNIAVAFHSFTRFYEERYNSHKKYLLDSPYIDVFIHTWTDRGVKYEFQLEKINEGPLLNAYSPKGFKSEFIWDKLKPEFSLVGKMYPIFLEIDQDKADATQYINANLYSINQALELIKEYEAANGFIYDGVIKLSFDLEITALDVQQIYADIQEDIFYSRKGCKRCEYEKCLPRNHDVHTNNIDITWYYGNRNVMEEAMSLYNNAYHIALMYHLSNIDNINNVAHRQNLDFIYIFKKEFNEVYTDINTRIVCYTPQRLMKEHMVNYKCKSATTIGCEILKPAVFNENI